MKINRLYFTFLLIFLAYFTAGAQHPGFGWAVQAGGNSYTSGLALAVDRFGNVFTTGSFQGTTDFDPGVSTFNLTYIASRDAYVLKLDSTGAFVWAAQFGGINLLEGVSLVVDSTGNVYVTGFYSGIADFDPGPGVYNLNGGNSGALFIVKLDPAGNLMWAHSIGGSGGSKPFALEIDAAGNIYCTGHFSGTVDFDPGPGKFELSPKGNRAVFLLKLTPGGNFIWCKLFEIDAEDFFSLAYNGADQLILSGYFIDTVDFDPGPGQHNLVSIGNYYNLFVLKLDTSGAFIWVKPIEIIDNSGIISTTASKTGDIIITGFYSSTINVDPTASNFSLTSVGGEDGFVAKFEASGNFKWALGFGSANNDRGTALAPIEGDKVFVGGYFRDTMVVSLPHRIDTLYVNQFYNLFLMRIDATGQIEWIEDMAATSQGFPNDMTADDVGHIYMTGRFSVTADFKFGPDSFLLTSLGIADMFLLKLGPCEINVKLEQNDNVLYAPSAGQSYQWVDCNNNYQHISGETGQSFTGTANGVYAVIITNGGCTDTSDCYTITGLGVDFRNSHFEMALFPNPTDGLLQVVLPNEVSNAQLTIIDINGRRAKPQTTFSGSQHYIDVSHLEAGIYLLEVRAEAVTIYAKWVKL